MVEYAGLSAASDGAREGSEWKWGLRTKEDSSEVRQEGSLEDQQGGGSNLHANYVSLVVCC